MDTDLGRRVWLVLVALLLVAGGVGVFVVVQRHEEKEAAREADAKKLTASSERDATQPIEDTDYRFRWSWPGAKWKLLNASEAGRMMPFSLAGALYVSVDKGFGWLVVGCEGKAAKHDLKRYAEGLPSYFNAKADHLEAKPVTHHGFSGYRLEAAVDRLGEASQFVAVAFDRDTHVCWVGGTGPAKPTTVEILDAGIAALVPTEGPIKERAPLPPSDESGLGWQRKDGVFRDAASGVVLTPPPGCRVAGGMEAHGGTTANRASYVCTTPSFMVSLGQMRAHRDETSWAEYIGEWSISGYEVRDETLELRTPKGRTLEVYVATDEVSGYEVLGMGLSLGEGRIVYLIVSHQPAVRADVLKRLGPLVDGISLMPVERRRQLATALMRNEVDSFDTSSRYRGRRYLDCEHGLSWKHERGPWLVRVGNQAAVTFEGARMWAHHPGLGVEVTHHVVSAPGPRFHADEQAKVDASDMLPPERLAPRKWGVIDVEATHWKAAPSGRLEEWLFTAVVDGVGIVVDVTSPVGLGEHEQAAVERVLEGFSFVRPVPLRQRTEGGTHIDEIGGFAFDMPRGMSIQQEQTTVGGRRIVATGKTGVLLALAGNLGEGDSSFRQQLLIQTMTGVLSKDGTAAPERDQIELDGRRVERVFIPPSTNIYHFVRNGQLFFLATSMMSDADTESVRKSFHLLGP